MGESMLPPYRLNWSYSKVADRDIFTGSNVPIEGAIKTINCSI
jgi:hypothetical protein